MVKLKITDLDLYHKKVLVRVDFNVPLDENQQITDDNRIIASLPTIQHIINNGGSAILMSHLGRPKGQKRDELSMAPVAKHLSKLLKQNVIIAPDCIGSEVQSLAENLQPGQILLLENLRFYEAETKPDKDPSFAEKLASLGDIYINDAFGTAHRAHSSTERIAHFFPEKAAAGFLMEKEISFLGSALTSPAHPFHTIIGGAKISTKINVLKSLIRKADVIIIGGGMAYNFFKVQGIDIGDSIHEDDYLETTTEIIELCNKSGVELLLPIDIKIADKYDNQAKSRIIDIQEGIPKGWQGLDIGPKTIELFSQKLHEAKTILWNGPLGVFEFNNFSIGTDKIAEFMSNSSATTIVGGGDCVAAVKKSGKADNLSHLSTGGGSTLEYIEKGSLPCIEALSDI